MIGENCQVKLKTYFISVQVYDPSTNTWTAGPDLTGYHQSFCSVATEDSIYVAGGFSKVNRLT